MEIIKVYSDVTKRRSCVNSASSVPGSQSGAPVSIQLKRSFRDVPSNVGAPKITGAVT